VSQPSQTEEKQSSPGSRAEAFALLIRDRRISHGAFRLWHALRDYMHSGTGKCFTGQRTLSEDIGCKPHSIRGWVIELVQSGWLSIECNGKPFPIAELLAAPKQRKQKGRRFLYQLLGGSGEPLPKRAAPPAAEMGNGFKRCRKEQRTAARKGNAPLPKGATEGRELRKESSLSNIENSSLRSKSDFACADAQQSDSAREKTAGYKGAW
jgi:hypothetical protein